MNVAMYPHMTRPQEPLDHMRRDEYGNVLPNTGRLRNQVRASGCAINRADGAIIRCVAPCLTNPIWNGAIIITNPMNSALNT
jgi:hypothetical protein